MTEDPLVDKVFDSWMELTDEQREAFDNRVKGFWTAVNQYGLKGPEEKRTWTLEEISTLRSELNRHMPTAPPKQSGEGFKCPTDQTSLMLQSDGNLLCRKCGYKLDPRGILTGRFVPDLRADGLKGPGKKGSPWTSEEIDSLGGELRGTFSFEFGHTCPKGNVRMTKMPTGTWVCSECGFEVDSWGIHPIP